MLLSSLGCVHCICWFVWPRCAFVFEKLRFPFSRIMRPNLCSSISRANLGIFLASRGIGPQFFRHATRGCDLRTMLHRVAVPKSQTVGIKHAELAQPVCASDALCLHGPKPKVTLSPTAPWAPQAFSHELYAVCRLCILHK